MKRAFGVAGRTLAWLLAILCAAWACGALYYDFPVLPGAVALVFALAVAAGLIFLRGRWRKLGAVFAAFVLVLVWWLTVKPVNDADWQPDVAQRAWAEINGDGVTIHNVRNCDYRTETDYTARWETRAVQLSKITGVDIALCYWGSPWMAHPIVSFQFENAPPLCFSIETRKKSGQTYSSIGGLYRQYELIYTVATERDVIRLRTNYRKGEDVFLYRTAASPAQARARFMEYLHSINDLRHKARWYNAITTNCTSAIRDQHPAAKRIPWDWRLLLNGKSDELMFEQRAIATGGLSFAELKSRALINQAAQAAGDAADFSLLIRKGRPGF